MSSPYPRLVMALTHHHDAWIVGSAANPNNNFPPRDIDICVPLSHWQAASSLIPSDAKVNSFGGWKCKDGDVEIDVWPGELGWVMQHPKAEWAFHPKTGVRLCKATMDEF